MRGIEHSYFHKFLCLGTHYVVAGHTEDQYCADDLQLRDVRMELHRYLLEQGFDAVIFFDEMMKLYCFDDRSFRILLRGRDGGEGDGFRSRMSSRRPGSRRPAADSAREQHTQPPTTRLNVGNISDAVAWNQLLALMTTTDYRVALVLNASNTFQQSLPPVILQLFQELGSYRTRNHSVVIHLFRQTDLDNLEESVGRGNVTWDRVYTTVLRPCIDSDTAESNRLISLPTPNAAEVRNLLNHFRLRLAEGVDVPVDPMAIQELSLAFADVCARKNWGLRELLLRMENFAQQNPGQPISLANWRTVAEDQGHLGPMETLERLVGMDELKEQIRSMRATAIHERSAGPRMPEYSCRFTAFEIPRSSMGHRLNIQLRGGPGTGKTTVARLMGEIYKELGMLSQGHLVEASGADLVSGYVGQTNAQIRAKVQEAMGGVLFIDEAYQLLSNQHGREALDQLVADMSRYEGQFAVVVAGYPEQIDALMQANPGLPRRFPTVYTLPDYTGEEMLRLLNSFLERRNRNDAASNRQFRFSEELQAELPNFCDNWVDGRNTTAWGNAGEAENLLSDMIFRHDRRQEKLPPEERDDVLIPADIPQALQDCLRHRSQNLDEAMAKVDGMIGLTNVKAFLRQLARNIQMGSEERAPGNYIFHGPPGTGKTFTARMMGEMLRLLGVLKRGHLVECQGGKLELGSRGGHGRGGENDLDTVVRNARGGMLFIDEAHQMSPAVVRALVPIIEAPDFHSDTAVVLAGYTLEIEHTLTLDPGLNRRFPRNHRIRFDHYTARELRDILETMAKAAGEIPSPAYLDRSQIALDNYLSLQAGSDFGNAGYIRDNYLPDSVAARTNRLTQKVAGDRNAIPSDQQRDQISEEERRTLTEYDIPASMESFAGPVGMPTPRQSGAERLLEELYGKQEIRDYARFRKTSSAETRFADEVGGSGLNFAVSGPLGSGRHTVCRALHELWREMGLLTGMKPHFTNETELVAGYISQTPDQARRVIQANLGTTLVIENPSSMLPKGHDGSASFGPEALNVIAGAMQQYAGRISFVLLDSQEGLERLFREYPGMKTSLTREFRLEDLSAEDMLRLFRLKARDSFLLSGRLADETALRDFMVNWVTDRGGLGDTLSSWGNGREIDALCRELKEAWKARFPDGAPREETRTWRDEDGREHAYTVKLREVDESLLPKRLKKYLKPSSELAETAMQELQALTGLRRVKQAVENIERRIYWTDPEDVTPGLYCFVGNPGVGKTKVAKLMGGILKAAGVLEIGHVVERTARQMAGDFQNFEKTLKLARGGVLFIDEAHQLRETPAGNEVIKRLLTALEDVDVIRRTCIILAGYPEQMQEMLDMDSGLHSRFGTEDSILVFEDYSPDELLQILKVMAAEPRKFPQIGVKEPLLPEQGYLDLAWEVFRSVCGKGDSDFGNARFVRNFLHDSVNRQLARIDRDYGRSAPLPDGIRSRLTREDIPEKYQELLQEKYPPARLHQRNLSIREPGPVTQDNYALRVEQAARSAVFLEIEFASGIGSGSGTIISTDGTILTANHNVENARTGEMARRIRAKLYTPGAVGGDYHWVDCQILSAHRRDCDMALLKLSGSNYPAAPLRPEGIPLDNTEEIFMVGYPLGTRLIEHNENAELRYSQSSGRIHSIQEPGGVQRCYADIKGLHGDSGAGVYSKRDGRIIGVFTGSIIPDMKRSLDELNFFYPIKHFWSGFRVIPEPPIPSRGGTAETEKEGS